MIYLIACQICPLLLHSQINKCTACTRLRALQSNCSLHAARSACCLTAACLHASDCSAYRMTARMQPAVHALQVTVDQTRLPSNSGTDVICHYLCSGETGFSSSPQQPCRVFACGYPVRAPAKGTLTATGTGYPVQLSSFGLERRPQHRLPVVAVSNP